MTDESLALMTIDGDGRAFADLVRRHRPLLGWLCSRYFIPGADRDDLEQEALIGLHEACLDYHAGRGSTFRSFAQMVVERHIQDSIKAQRAKKRLVAIEAVSLDKSTSDSTGRPVPLGELLAADGADPHAILEQREDVRALVALSTRVSPLERTVLTRVLSGASLVEAGAGLGKPGSKPLKVADNALQRIRRRHAATLAGAA